MTQPEYVLIHAFKADVYWLCAKHKDEFGDGKHIRSASEAPAGMAKPCHVCGSDPAIVKALK